MNTEPTPVNMKFQMASMSGIVGARLTPQAAGASGEGEQGTNIVDQNGTVLTNVQVHLIFWGSDWNKKVSPLSDEVTQAVENILSGSYMSGLSQYRGIGKGTLHGTTPVTSSDPPHPFSTDDVAHLVLNLIATGKVPKPCDVQQIWYCVIMPVGVNCKQASINGEHSFVMNFSYSFPIEVRINKVIYGWVTNDGTLAGVTSIFSHELVESCTNPEGTGFQILPLDPGSWHEIGDVCEGITAEINGVSVQAYWSQNDDVCVIPGLLVPSPSGAYPFKYEKE